MIVTGSRSWLFVDQDYDCYWIKIMIVIEIFIICLFVCLCIYLFACVFICLFIYLFSCVFIYLFVCFLVYLFIYLFSCVFICLFIYLFYPSVTLYLCFPFLQNLRWSRTWMLRGRWTRLSTVTRPPIAKQTPPNVGFPFGFLDLHRCVVELVPWYHGVDAKYIYDTIFGFCFLQMTITMGDMFPHLTITHRVSSPYSGEEVEALGQVWRTVATLVFWMPRSNAWRTQHPWWTTCCQGVMAMTVCTSPCSWKSSLSFSTPQP